MNYFFLIGNVLYEGQGGMLWLSRVTVAGALSNTDTWTKFQKVNRKNNKLVLSNHFTHKHNKSAINKCIALVHLLIVIKNWKDELTLDFCLNETGLLDVMGNIKMPATTSIPAINHAFSINVLHVNKIIWCLYSVSRKRKTWCTRNKNKTLIHHTVRTVAVNHACSWSRAEQESIQCKSFCKHRWQAHRREAECE